MPSYLLTTLAMAATILAVSPPGFQPVVHSDLAVSYGSTLINGQVIPQSITTAEPRIASPQRLPGSSYAVFMVDLDIPTDVEGQTSTLLHWIQTGLQAAATASADGTFGLSNPAQLPPVAHYIAPNPPARTPRSHRYVQLLVDTSNVALGNGSAAYAVLTTAAQTRIGFNVQQVLQQAGLYEQVVEANYFNVTNTDNSTTPATASATASATTSATASGTTSAATSVVTAGSEHLLPWSVGLVAVLAGAAALAAGL